MSNESPAFIAYLKEANKFLAEELKKKSEKVRHLEEENWILRDEVSAWEHTARIQGWNVRLVYPTNPVLCPAHQLEDEDIPF